MVHVQKRELHGPGAGLNELYKEINMRMLDCIKKDSVPYLQENPLPQDMNVVNGRHFGDINKIQLELKAGQIRAKSLKWIYKADADFMGLELKSGADSSPVTVYANVSRSGAASEVESQDAYLLEQFTGESLRNALGLTRTDGGSKEDVRKRAVAQNMLRNIAEYDAGSNERRLRENRRRNISENLKNAEILRRVSEAYDNATGRYDAAQKTIFGALNGWFIRQETGLNLSGGSSPARTEELKQALEAAAKADSPRLAKTLADCFLYSERLTHYEFSPERVYTKDDLNKSLSVLAPAAARFEPENAPDIARNREEKIREREKEIRPRRITHQRGL